MRGSNELAFIWERSIAREEKWAGVIVGDYAGIAGGQDYAIKTRSHNCDVTNWQILVPCIALGAKSQGYLYYTSNGTPEGYEWWMNALQLRSPTTQDPAWCASPWHLYTRITDLDYMRGELLPATLDDPQAMVPCLLCSRAPRPRYF